MAKARSPAKAKTAKAKAPAKPKATAKATTAAAKPKPAGKAAKGASSTDAILKELRAFGLAYPGAHLKSPWPEHLDLAVNDKTFAYLSLEGQPLGVGCKLPKSAAMALMLPFASPMAYGLGKSGWVSAQVPPGTPVDVEMFKAWLDESYRAQAPKTLVKQLDAGLKAPGRT